MAKSIGAQTENRRSEKCPIRFYLEPKVVKKQKEPKINPDIIFDDHKDISSGQNEREER